MKLEKNFENMLIIGTNNADLGYIKKVTAF